MATIYNISVAPAANPFNDKDEGPIRADGKFRVQYVSPMGVFGTRYYAAGEYLTFPEAPAAPNQYGVFKEWNYDSIQVYQPLNVGAIYDTVDHNTHVLLLVKSGAIERSLNLTDIEGGFDWGEGTYTPGTTLTHTYAAPGRYWLTIEGNFNKSSNAAASRPAFGDCLEIWLGSTYTPDAAYMTAKPTTLISFSPVMSNMISSSVGNFVNQTTVPALVFPKTMTDFRYPYYTGNPVMSITMDCKVSYYSDSNANYPKSELIMPMDPTKQSTCSFGSGSFTTTSTTQINRIIYGPGYRYTNNTTIPITNEVWFTNHGTLYWNSFKYNPGKLVIYSDAWATPTDKANAESYFASNNITIQ